MLIFSLGGNHWGAQRKLFSPPSHFQNNITNCRPLNFYLDNVEDLKVRFSPLNGKRSLSTVDLSPRGCMNVTMKD